LFQSLGFEYDQFMLDTSDTSTVFNHHFIEACKLAFGLRDLVGDDNFVDSNNVSKVDFD
jgi:hypothetical protein